MEEKDGGEKVRLGMVVSWNLLVSTIGTLANVMDRSLEETRWLCSRLWRE